MIEASNPPRFTPSEFLAVANQSLDYAFPVVELEGEVASFKISKDKWVFFDLKDKNSTVSCFMTVFNLRFPIEDGMKILVRGKPKLTNFGKFSFTVSSLKPVGEGSLKKSFELLKEKLKKEGLFSPERKRKIEKNPKKIGVISSVNAAGYADFLKILNARWGGIKILVKDVAVQGASAADEIINALKFFNEKSDVEVLVLIRGGGSKDDLSVFNDELLAREIARSKIPVLTGIGHEVDESLADLVADLRASTPSNAAELLTSDKAELSARLKSVSASLKALILKLISEENSALASSLSEIKSALLSNLKTSLAALKTRKKTLAALDPEAVLKRGYAIVSGNLSPGSLINLTTSKNLIKAEIKNVKPRE